MSWEPGISQVKTKTNTLRGRMPEWLRERRAVLDAERAAKEAAEARPKCPRCKEPLEERTFKNLKVDVRSRVTACGSTPASSRWCCTSRVPSCFGLSVKSSRAARGRNDLAS